MRKLRLRNQWKSKGFTAHFDIHIFDEINKTFISSQFIKYYIYPLALITIYIYIEFTCDNILIINMIIKKKTLVLEIFFHSK
ncbi:hypothetical protein Z042_25210 [Chania multitudinisentens RB-25]|uniref:Uncharacterized protein n=1 Tax=Chania multitudinisentens RB-25 TaxID=1441930 RepID=W0LL20_9GAMM|nr:hypothetical protein Z042_25210 [Chania multitudinisentens RB-25]